MPEQYRSAMRLRLVRANCGDWRLFVKPSLPWTWISSSSKDVWPVRNTAWEDLVKAHTRRVYAICYRFTGTDHEAQDLTQDVFVRLFRSLKSYRVGEGSFVVWLSRLTRNLLIDHYRRTKLDRVTDSIEGQLPMLEEKTAASARTDGILAGREASEVLQAGLQRLSPELREAVILRDLEEMEYKEIAQVLNVPEGTVKSRLNRGRAELARVLRQKGVQA